MKIVVDENITFANEAFSSLGEIHLYNGREITNYILKDAESLIVRSITNVNEELLKNTSVKFVGTATIGTDHIDLDYLKNQEIYFADAAGCNSFAVTEYVFSSISSIISLVEILNKSPKLGIVGYGNIGKKVAQMGEALGLEVLINDPPLERETQDNRFSPLDEILDCDIITCHVPLNLEGIDKTYHLIDENKLNRIKPGTILINSSRGSVINNQALLNRLQKKQDLHVVLDVWENEPDFIPELLNLVKIGTPHIAGYSLEGKVNGTVMIYNELCKYLGKTSDWKPELPIIQDNKIELKSTDNKFELLNDIFEKVYNVKNDDELLREALKLNDKEKVAYFDSLRKNYRFRRELNNYEIHLNEKFEENYDWLKEFRLKLNSPKIK